VDLMLGNNDQSISIVGDNCVASIDRKALPSLLSALAQRVCIHHELVDDCALFPLARKHR
jgi:hypothetical protein